MTTNINPAPVTIVQPQGPGGFQGQQADTLQRIINDLVRTEKTLNQALEFINQESSGGTIELPLLFADPGVVPANFKLEGLAEHQVLMATGEDAASFEQLTLNDIVGFDIEDPANGQVIAFVDGYWTNVDPASLGGITGGQNLGSGAGIWSGIDDANLTFKSLVEGPGITITPAADSIKLSAATASAARGRQGPPGDEGRDGRRGRLGPPGKIGSAGAAGTRGRAGVPGADGEDGQRGRMGAPGRSIQGARGASGRPGTSGSAGERGRRGPPGRAGAGGGGGGSISLTAADDSIVLDPSTITGTGTIAQSQSWSPTQTGNWIFAPSSGIGVEINAASGESGLIVNGAGGAGVALVVNAQDTAGEANGLFVFAGSNSSDYALYIANAANTVNLFYIVGDGGAVVGGATGGDKGSGTLNAVGLYVEGAPVSTAVGANPSASVGLAAVDGSADTWMRSDASPALSQAITPNWTGEHVFGAVVDFNSAANFNLNLGGGWPNSTTIAGGSLAWNHSSGGGEMTFINGYWTASASFSWLQQTAAAAGTLLMSLSPAAVLNVIGGIEINGTPVSTAVGANPSATVGLSAVDGSAATWMRSDGAPALNQTISPTMTGNWVFAPTSGTALLVDAVANSFGVSIQGSATTGQSNGLIIFAGTDSSDLAFYIANAANSAAFLAIYGDGHGFWSNVNSTGISMAATGAIAILAPTSSAVALAVTGTANVTQVLFGDGTIETAHSTVTGVSASWGTITNHGFNITTDDATRVAIAAGGAVTINAPSSAAPTLTLTGAANSDAIEITGSATTGQSFGLSVLAGTTSGDACAYFATQSNTPLLELYGDGSIVAHGATGGALGPGTFNATNYYVNGRLVAPGGVGASSLTTLTQSGGASQTYNVPAGANFVQVICIGGGAGGQAGSMQNSGSAANGGAGGGSGGVSMMLCTAAALGSSVTITFSNATTGGDGAAGRSTAGSGAQGIAGSNVNFGGLLIAYGGAPGNVVTGGLGGTGTYASGLSGGGATSGGVGAAGTPNSATPFTATNFSPTGGGGGGSTSAGNTAFAGGAGGGQAASLPLVLLTGGAGGTSGGNAGTGGNNGSGTHPATGGGGGGAAAGSTSGGAGASGGQYGAGGGGGGAAQTGAPSTGPGGNGGPAACIILAW